MNPVAALLVEHPDEYRWSSARAHLARQDDELVKVAPLLDLVPDWQGFLKLSPKQEVELFYRHEHSGRPLGGSSFVDHLNRPYSVPYAPANPDRREDADSYAIN
jgi:putative transposase